MLCAVCMCAYVYCVGAACRSVPVCMQYGCGFVWVVCVQFRISKGGVMVVNVPLRALRQGSPLSPAQDWAQRSGARLGTTKEVLV